MRKNLIKIALTASLVLALAFTFSCSDDSSKDNIGDDVGISSSSGGDGSGGDGSSSSGDNVSISSSSDGDDSGGDGSSSSGDNVSISSSSGGDGSSGSPGVSIGITAAQLVANIKIGWNLGNTLDAADLTNSGWPPANSTIQEFETAWGNPVTTMALITTLKNAGFNGIRIPVTWHKVLDANNKIHADWMGRVKEIVDYAVANGMYIILNTHHDESIFKFTNAQKTSSLAVFKKIWEQIANNFKDYDEKLIFEALNEPRNIGASWEWNGGNPEERNNLNEYYQLFVNTIRASGGNNYKRILMINTYGANLGSAAMNGLVIPTDPVSNKIIVSYHAYEPFNYAHEPNSPYTWNATNSFDTSPITEPIDRYYEKFVRAGIPVIIGEFGANDKNTLESRVAWAKYYVSYATSKGIKCFWWDTGAEEPNRNMRLIDRSTNTFIFPDIIDALMMRTTTPIITPPTISNLGSYILGTDEYGSTNPQQAVWELSPANVTIAKAAGAKLELKLGTAPNAALQLIWQGPDNALWWNQADINASNMTWNASTKTLTINLSSALKDYSIFTAQSSLNIIIAYYSENGVSDLGIVSASLIK